MQSHKNNRKISKTRQLTVLSMLLATAFILSWIEMISGITTGIPGIKLGLANIVIMFTVCVCGKKEGFLVLIGRLILNAMLFGNALSLIYSLAGGLLSFIIICLAIYVFKLGNIISSICGGIFHNVGQIIVALIILKSPAIIYYLPYLIIGGIIAGAINGFIVKKISRLKVFSEIYNQKLQ